MINCICKQCGSNFKTYPAVVKSGKGKYCNSECYHNSTKTRIKCICQYCDIDFYIDPSKIKRGGGKYCNNNCFRASQIKAECICKQCDKEFKVIPSKLKQGKGKFCSDKCKLLFYTGDNNNLWKGGISNNQYPSTWTERFRRSIRKRDCYLCAICNRHQDEFNRSHSVHHIDGDKMNTTKENCISVCNRHHMIIEKSGKAQTFWAPRLRNILNKIHGYNKR